MVILRFKQAGDMECMLADIIGNFVPALLIVASVENSADRGFNP
jgi:hypothetical protein